MPKRDRFRRAVESAVLPFLSDVQSPIAREQYVRAVAARLHVSELAVSEALARLPRAGGEISYDERPAPSAKKFSENRAKHAYAILLWQESLPTSTLDTKAYEKDLAEAIGVEEFAALQALPDSEKERLRFSMERQYGAEHSPRADAMALTNILLRERLMRELAEITSSLKKAEANLDADESKALMERSRVLTSRLAKLHEKE